MNEYNHISGWKPFGFTFKTDSSPRVQHWDRFGPDIQKATESFLDAAKSEWPFDHIEIIKVQAYTPDEWLARLRR